MHASAPIAKHCGCATYSLSENTSVTSIGFVVAPQVMSRVLAEDHARRAREADARDVHRALVGIVAHGEVPLAERRRRVEREVRVVRDDRAAVRGRARRRRPTRCCRRSSARRSSASANSGCTASFSRTRLRRARRRGEVRRLARAPVRRRRAWCCRRRAPSTRDRSARSGTRPARTAPGRRSRTRAGLEVGEELLREVGVDVERERRGDRLADLERVDGLPRPRRGELELRVLGRQRKRRRRQ